MLMSWILAYKQTLILFQKCSPFNNNSIVQQKTSNQATAETQISKFISAKSVSSLRQEGCHVLNE